LPRRERFTRRSRRRSHRFVTQYTAGQAKYATTTPRAADRLDLRRYAPVSVRTVPTT